jgi:opacity protein-like surface antigen
MTGRDTRRAILVVSLLFPAVALAQQPPEKRVEVGGGLRWIGPVHFNDVNANETTFGGGTRTVFESTSVLQSLAGVEGRVAIRLTPTFQAESSIVFGRTHLATHLTADAEAADVTATEPLTQYVLEAGLVAQLGRRRSGRARPFATGGIGYVRHLHDQQTLIETGQSAYAGAGLRYLLRGPRAGRSQDIGIRAELRGMILNGGLTLDGARHIVPTVSAALFVRY